MRHIAWKLPIGILALMAASVATAQPRAAGEVLAVKGAVTLQKPGAAATPLTVGADVPRGTTVATGADSSARLRMRDNSYIALAPNSGFQIEKFALPRAGKTKDPGTAVFSLLRGGFRTITGLIGKFKQDTYQIRTPVATMGIRGTEYSAYLCQNCAAAGANAENGLYIEVHSGAVILTNTNGTLTLMANEFGFAAEVAGSAPEKLNNRPIVFELIGGIFAPAANISGGASGSAGTDGVEVQPEPPRVEPPASPSRP